MRQVAIWINEWVWFERMILIVIVINAILYGAKDYSYIPTATSEAPIINQICDNSRYVVTAIYFVEMLIKIFATGIIVGKKTYLRNLWNLFDMLILVTCFISLVPKFLNLSVFRTLRFYRFCQQQQKVPSMSTIIEIISKSLLQLFHLSVLLFTCQIFYATVGLQIWSGMIHNRCRLTPTPIDGDWLPVPNDYRVCGG